MNKRIELDDINKEITHVWEKVFGYKPAIGVSVGSVQITDSFEIRSVVLEVERKTLSGVKVVRIDGYGIYASVVSSGGADLPESSDNVTEVEIGTANTFADALVILIQEVAKDKAFGALEIV